MITVIIISLFLLAQSDAHSCTTTLYEADAWSASISFSNGTASLIYSDYYPVEYDTDITLGIYAQGNITISPQGSRLGAYVDLGTEHDLMALYQVNVPAGAMYMTIHYDYASSVNTLVIAKNYQKKTFQPMKASQLDPLNTVSQLANFRPTEGHIYLIGIKDAQDKTFYRLVKMMVSKYIEGQGSSAVSIRWDVLKDSIDPKGTFTKCFSVANTPNEDNGQKKEQSVPGYVSIGVIVLFVVVGLLCIFALLTPVIFFRAMKYMEYEKINE